MSAIIVNAPRQHQFQYSTEDEKKVMELFLQGTSHANIQQITQLPLPQITRIIRLSRLQDKAQKLQEQLTEEAIKTKIPLMRQINEVTLSTILSYVQNLSLEPQRVNKMSPRDIKDLMGIVTSSAELINLTIGTQVKLPHHVDPDVLGPMFQVIIENTAHPQKEQRTIELTKSNPEASPQAGDSNPIVG